MEQSEHERVLRSGTQALLLVEEDYQRLWGAFGRMDTWLTADARSVEAACLYLAAVPVVDVQEASGSS